MRVITRSAEWTFHRIPGSTMKCTTLALLAAIIAPAPAYALRPATPDERKAIFADLGDYPRCTIEPAEEQVTVSDLDPFYAAVHAAPDCDFEWIVSERSGDGASWVAIAYGDQLESCQVIDDPDVAAELDVCATAKTCRASRAPKALGKELRRIAGEGGGRGPVGRTRYGVCGRERWALAKFSYPAVGVTDQPALFRKRGGRWRSYGGVGGSPLCETAYRGPLPFEMLDAWRIDIADCVNQP